MAQSKSPFWTSKATISSADALPAQKTRTGDQVLVVTIKPGRLRARVCGVGLRHTSHSSRWWVVLGKGEATAGQYVLPFQVLEFQDINLTPDYCWISTK